MMLIFVTLTFISLASSFYRTFANRNASDVTPQNETSHLGLFSLLRGILSPKNGIKF